MKARFLSTLLLVFSLFTLTAQTGLVSGELNVSAFPSDNGNGTFSLVGTFSDSKGVYFAADVAADMSLWKGNNYFKITVASANGNQLTLTVEDTYTVGFMGTGVYSIGEETQNLKLPGVSTTGDSNPALSTPPDYASKLNYILKLIDQGISDAGKNGMFDISNQDSLWDVDRYYIQRRVDGFLGDKGEFVLQDSSGSQIGPVFTVTAGTGGNPAYVQLGDGVDMPFLKIEGQQQSGIISVGFGDSTYHLPTVNPGARGLPEGTYVPVVDADGNLVDNGWGSYVSNEVVDYLWNTYDETDPITKKISRLGEVGIKADASPDAALTLNTQPSFSDGYVYDSLLFNIQESMETMSGITDGDSDEYLYLDATSSVAPDILRITATIINDQGFYNAVSLGSSGVTDSFHISVNDVIVHNGDSPVDGYESFSLSTSVGDVIEVYMSTSSQMDVSVYIDEYIGSSSYAIKGKGALSLGRGKNIDWVNETPISVGSALLSSFQFLRLSAYGTAGLFHSSFQPQSFELLDYSGNARDLGYLQDSYLSGAIKADGATIKESLITAHRLDLTNGSTLENVSFSGEAKLRGSMTNSFVTVSGNGSTNSAYNANGNVFDEILNSFVTVNGTLTKGSSTLSRIKESIVSLSSGSSNGMLTMEILNSINVITDIYKVGGNDFYSRNSNVVSELDVLNSNGDIDFQDVIYSGFTNVLLGDEFKSGVYRFDNCNLGSLSTVLIADNSIFGGSTSTIRYLNNVLGNVVTSDINATNSLIVGEDLEVGDASNTLDNGAIIGEGLIATTSAEPQMIVGQFNENWTDPVDPGNERILVVGNGIHDANRSNAMYLQKDGDLYLPSYLDGDVSIVGGKLTSGVLKDTIIISFPAIIGDTLSAGNTPGFWTVPDHLIGSQIIEVQYAFQSSHTGGTVDMQLTDGFVGYAGVTIADGDRVDSTSISRTLTSEEIIQPLRAGATYTVPPTGLIVNLTIVK